MSSLIEKLSQKGVEHPGYEERGTRSYNVAATLHESICIGVFVYLSAYIT